MTLYPGFPFVAESERRAPFLPPARRTGQADLPHPALRPELCLRPQRAATDTSLQFHQAQPFVKIPGWVGRTFATLISMFPLQPPAEPSAGVLLHRLPGCQDVADAEVIRPAQQHRVELANLLRGGASRRVAAGRQADLVTDRLDLLRGRRRA